jgi:hypothetical protein
MRAWLVAVAILTAGCDGDDRAPLDLGVARDLAPPARDLAVPDLALPDLALPDLAIAADLSTESDLSFADLQAMTCDSDGPECAVFRCGAGIDSPPYEGATHVPVGSTINYIANPPASGNHYPTPAAWGVYTTALARGSWVHNLEHGGIVLSYNCPGGCDADVQQLIAIRDATPPDRFNEQRLIVTPDPLMPHRFAAVAWLYRWQGEALDAAAINCFIGARYDRAPESLP